MPKYAGRIWGTVFRKYILHHLLWFWEASLICMLQEGILYFCDLLDLLLFSSSVCGKASSWQNFLPWKSEFRMKNRVSFERAEDFCVCMCVRNKWEETVYYSLLLWCCHTCVFHWAQNDLSACLWTNISIFSLLKWNTSSGKGSVDDSI